MITPETSRLLILDWHRLRHDAPHETRDDIDPKATAGRCENLGMMLRSKADNLCYPPAEEWSGFLAVTLITYA